MIFRMGAGAYLDPGALSLLSVRLASLLNACLTHVGLGRMSRFRPMVAYVWPLPSIIGRL